MRPSSSPSDFVGSTGLALFAGVFARGRVAAEVGDDAWLQAMLDVEAALARAAARAGVVTDAAAAEIVAVARAELFDPAQLGFDAADTGTPVLPLVVALRAKVPESASGAVHVGATSQDVVDTAMMLVTQRALVPLLDDLEHVSGAVGALAQRHRDTPMMGRTLLQNALPTTFGTKASAWLAGIDDARVNLERVASTRLALQFGGAVGTLDALGDNGAIVRSYLAEALGLTEPPMPWHTMRTRVLDVAAALVAVGGVLGKIAHDIELLAQQEVGEVHEARAEGRGASSAMPHKQNPVAAVAVVACTRRLPGLLATIAASMEQEHERAAGAWQAEWETVTDLLRLTGSAAAWAAEMFDRLEVDEARMRANVAAFEARRNP